MAETNPGVGDIEFPTQDPEKLGLFWGAELKASHDWMEKFITRSGKIERRYIDEREDMAAGGHFLNLFWSNTEVLMAAIYAQPPKVEAQRPFLDQDDDVARVAGNILVRTIENDIHEEGSDEEAAIRDAITDRLIVGLGQVWVRYQVETGKPEDAGYGNNAAAQGQPVAGPTGAPAGPTPAAPQPEVAPQQGMLPGMPLGMPAEPPLVPEPPTEVITDEKSPLDHVRWEDFRCGPSRRWKDVPWVARRVYMNKMQLTARFGAKICEIIPLEEKITKGADDDTMKFAQIVKKQAQVWEIWCKVTKKVYWYAKGAPVILDMKDDPIKFPGFWPCPEPLLATTTTASLIPRCEYYLAQDQYEELDLVATRIHLLVEAVRVAGVYDKNNEGLKAILSTKASNEMIPVANWAMFSERGGLKGAVDWFPLEMIINTIEKLTMRKTELIQEIYQILGISDIMRGMSNPNETAAAQNLKVQFGGARIGKIQGNIARFVTTALQLKGHIIKEFYQPSTIIEKSNVMLSIDAPFAQQAIAFLKGPQKTECRVKIQADSMSNREWLAQKQQRAEVIQGVSQFIGMSMPLIQSTPEAGPYLIKMLQWAVAGFKGGQELESVLDQAFAAMSKPKQPKPPSPQEIADVKKTESEAGKNAALAQKAMADAGVAKTEQALAVPNLMIDAAFADIEGKTADKKGEVRSD